MPKLQYVLKSDPLFQNPATVFTDNIQQVLKDLTRYIPSYRTYKGKDAQPQALKPLEPIHESGYSITDPQTLYIYQHLATDEIISEKFGINTDNADFKSYKLLATYAYQIYLINLPSGEDTQLFKPFIDSISKDNIKMMCLLHQGYFSYEAIGSFKHSYGFCMLATPYISNEAKISFSKYEPQNMSREIKIDSKGISCTSSFTANFSNLPFADEAIVPAEAKFSYNVNINWSQPAILDTKESDEKKTIELKEEKASNYQQYVSATLEQDVEIQDYILDLFFAKVPKKDDYKCATFVLDNTKIMHLLINCFERIKTFDPSLQNREIIYYQNFWFKNFLYAIDYKPTTAAPTLELQYQETPKKIKITTLAYIIDQVTAAIVSNITSTLNDNELISIINKLYTLNKHDTICKIINSLSQNNNHMTIYRIINNLSKNNNHMTIYRIINSLSQNNNHMTIYIIINNLSKNNHADLLQSIEDSTNIDLYKYTAIYDTTKKQASKFNSQNKIASIGAFVIFMINYFIIIKLTTSILLTKIALGCFAAGSILYALLSILNLYKLSKYRTHQSLPTKTTENLAKFKDKIIQHHHKTYRANAVISLCASILLFSMASLKGILIVSYLGQISFLLSLNIIISIFAAKIITLKSNNNFNKTIAYTSITCSTIFAPLIANPIVLTSIFAINLIFITFTNKNNSTNASFAQKIALNAINFLLLAVFYLSIITLPSYLIYAAVLLSAIAISLQELFFQQHKKSCCSHAGGNRPSESISKLVLSKALTEEQKNTLNNHKKGIKITAINGATISYENPNKLTNNQILSGIQSLLPDGKNLSLKSKQTKLNTSGLKIIFIGFVAIYIAHIYLPNLLSMQLLLAATTISWLLLQKGFFTSSKETIQKFHPAIIGIASGLLLMNAAPFHASLIAISVLSIIIFTKAKKTTVKLASFIFWYILVNLAATNPVILGGSILIGSLIFCIVQADNISMEQAQNISIVLILIAQISGLFFPTLGFPMACWHHAILMQLILEISHLIKQKIQQQLSTQPPSSHPTLFDLPIALDDNTPTDKIINGQTISISANIRLPCFATVGDSKVLIEKSTLTGQEGEPAFAYSNSTLPKGTLILSDCEVTANLEAPIEKLEEQNPFYFLKKNFTKAMFILALLAGGFAWIIGSSIISAICSVLVLACPCVFATIDQAIEYTSLTMLANTVKINETNSILNNLLKLNKALGSKRLSLDKTGTLTESRAEDKHTYPDTKNNTSGLLNKLCKQNYTIKIITGATNNQELQSFATTLNKSESSTSHARTIPREYSNTTIDLISCTNKKGLNNKYEIHIGDGANDIKAWNDNGVGICLSHTPDATAQYFHFKMTNKEQWQAHLFSLFNTAQWAKYSLYISYTCVILYSIICATLASIGIITPMLSCLLLCALSIITPGCIILAAKLYNPGETLPAKSANEFTINITTENTRITTIATQEYSVPLRLES
jgi:cation transport ATPase